jgi:hypothetical protein
MISRGNRKIIGLPCSLIIEATEEPDYFGFYSPELEGFSGIGHSVEDCMSFTSMLVSGAILFL